MRSNPISRMSSKSDTSLGCKLKTVGMNRLGMTRAWRGARGDRSINAKRLLLSANVLAGLVPRRIFPKTVGLSSKFTPGGAVRVFLVREGFIIGVFERCDLSVFVANRVMMKPCNNCFLRLITIDEGHYYHRNANLKQPLSYLLQTMTFDVGLSTFDVISRRTPRTPMNRRQSRML